MHRCCHSVVSVGMAVMVSVMDSLAGHPEAHSLGLSQAKECFTVTNGRVEAIQVDGEQVIRWHINPGQTSRLELPETHPLFAQLRFYDRFDLEFRVASGEINGLDMQALRQVSGPYQGKLHEWHLSVRGPARLAWQTRRIELARPDWYPWDNPDGDGQGFLRLSCLALAPNTVIELRQLRLQRLGLRLKPDFELPVSWPILTRNPDGSATYTATYQVMNTVGRPLQVIPSVVSAHKRFSVRISAVAGPTPTRGDADRVLKNGEVAAFELVATMTAADVAATEELYAEPLEVAFAPAGDVQMASRSQGFLVRPLTPGIRRQVVIGQGDLETIHRRLTDGDPDIRQAIDLDRIQEVADSFLAKRLVRIPVNHRHPGNAWEGEWRPGDSMPEIVNASTGEREFGTERAAYTWKEYLGHTGAALECLGKAYLYTDDERYATKAAELFDLYARQYAEQPWGPGFNAIPWERPPVAMSASRVAASSSYGSNWYFKGHCRLLSMVCESPAWSPELSRRVYQGFVLPYATELMKFPGGINNMTDITHHNLLLLGIVFDDAGLVHRALLSDAGLAGRLRDIDGDGFSSEGRPVNYHWASMAEYLPSIAYLENSGLAVAYPKDRLLAAVRMPYLRAALNGMIPNSGDCGRGQRLDGNGFGGLLAPLFPEEGWLYDAGASPLACLLAGKGVGAERWRKLLATEPLLFRAAGLAILRSGADADTQVMATLDYGRNVMHGALDRNQITLLAFGRVFTHGPGSLYNAGSGGIVRADDPRLISFAAHGSLAHNVVLVDQRDQLPAVGRLLAWHIDAERQSVASQVDGIAPGVTHIRALTLVRGVLVLFDRLISEDEHVYDFVYHNAGGLKLGGGWQATPIPGTLGDTANYGSVIEPQRLTGEGDIRLDWDLSLPPPAVQEPTAAPRLLPGVWLSLWQGRVAGGDVFTGVTGFNNPDTGMMPDRAPSLFHRVRAAQAEFATVLEPHRGVSAIRSVRFPSESAVEIHWLAGGTTRLSLDHVLHQKGGE